MNPLRKAANILDHINNFLTIVAGIILIFLMLSVVYEVVTRYFLGHSQVWVLEITSHMLPFLTFFVAAWVLKREGHVRVEIVISRLNPRTNALITVITSFIAAIICLVLAWYGTEVIQESFQTGSKMATELEPPKWSLLWIVPLGGLLLAIQFIRRAFGYLEKWRASPQRGQGS